MVIPDGDEHFVVTLEVAISPLFYAWVFDFGKDAEILSPEDIRNGAVEMAQEIVDVYRENK